MTDNLPPLDAEQVARQFHEAYERLAPSLGYETRAETRHFDPLSANGRLMIAVCGEVGEACYRQALEDASWACGAVAFDGCHEWRREAVNMCLAAIRALIGKNEQPDGGAK